MAQQSIERLQDLMFVKMRTTEDALQALADKALSASNTPQGGQQLLAHGQPPSPSEMPPSAPQSPPPAPHAEAGEGTNESLAGVLGAVMSALNKQSSSVAAALPKMAWSVHPQVELELPGILLLSWTFINRLLGCPLSQLPDDDTRPNTSPSCTTLLVTFSFPLMNYSSIALQSHHSSWRKTYRRMHIMSQPILCHVNSFSQPAK